MKKLSLSLLLGATFAATIFPAAASATEPGTVPGCWRGFTFDLANSHPVPGVRNIGLRNPDRNGDGFVCYAILHDRRGDPWAFIWMDNRNKWDPEEL